MKRKIICLTLIFFFFIPLSIQAQPLSWDSLTQFLQNRFPPRFKKISQIKEKYKDRIVFQFRGPAPRRGIEYLVLTEQPGVPLYLQRPAGVIRVESIFGQEALAQIMATLGKKIAVGDNIVIPSSPVIYLYTNIKDKDVFNPYQSLRKELLKNNYEVVEIKSNKVIPATDRYGIVIRLEGGEKYLVCKVQSLYSNDTLFAQTQKYEQAFATEAPIGQNIMLAPRVIRQPTAIAVAPVSPAFPPYAPSPTVPRKQPKTFREARLPSTNVSNFRKAMAQTSHAFYRLRKSYKRFVICDIVGDGKPDFVFLNDQGLFRYTLENNQLNYIDQYTFDNNDIIALHLHSMDVDGDGKDDLVVTLAEKVTIFGKQDTRLVSMIVKYDRNTYGPIVSSFPYYLRVIEDRAGRKILLGQKKGKYEPYTGDILQFKWNPNQGTLSDGIPYKPAHDVYSLYQFNLVPDNPKRILILEPNHYIDGYYAPEERVDATSDIDYGSFKEYPYPIKLENEQFLGGFTKQTFKDFYAPRRFALHVEYDGQCFLINKEREPRSIIGVVKTYIKQGTGRDSVGAAKWVGDQIASTWESLRISKDLLDFSFLHQGTKDTLFVMIRDNEGYAVESLR